jgi:hypothetical protein
VMCGAVWARRFISSIEFVSTTGVKLVPSGTRSSRQPLGCR